ncbi:MAG: AEC family transporter [Caulobacteraceae bacterium]|nr:AEC family transporter [Caulobacteraceae bacterium]
MDVLSRIAPFFLLIACGVVAARARVVDAGAARALSTYVFWIAFPALLIHGLESAPIPDAATAKGLAAYGLGQCAALATPLVVGRLLGWPRAARAGAAMAAGVGNTAFLGAPLGVSLLGPAAGAPAAAMVAIDFTVILALATAGLHGAAHDAAHDATLPRRILRTLANPLVGAAAVGVGLSALRLAPPEPIDRALGLLAATASPVGLVALGVVVGAEFGRPRGVEATAEGPAVALVMAVRLVAAPALIWLLTGLAGADPGFRAVAVLLAACPTAVSVFIQTRTLGVFAHGGALAVIATSMASALTLTGLAFLLAHR